MITAEVEIDNNSDLDYFKSLQPIAWPTPLYVYVWCKDDNDNKRIIFLKVEPSLTDVIFLLVDQKNEKFYGYVWLKIDVYNKRYNLVNYQILINNIESLDLKFNYVINVIAKIIKNGYDLKVQDEQLILDILKHIPNIERNNNILLSTQPYFEGLEGVTDTTFGFNTQYVKWIYNPIKYKFFPGRIDNSLYPYPL